MSPSSSYKPLWDGNGVLLAQAPATDQPIRLELTTVGTAVITDGQTARALANYLNAFADWHELWTIHQRPDTDLQKRVLLALLGEEGGEEVTHTS